LRKQIRSAKLPIIEVKTRILIYNVAGFLSGIIWTVVTLGFTHTLETFSLGASFVYFVFGGLTGLGVSQFFKRGFSGRGPLFFFLPVVTLAVASQMFATLHWIWLKIFHPYSFGSHALLGMLVTFGGMTFLSVLFPVFFGLALLNQWLMRFILTSRYQGIGKWWRND
jgi:hypothetical protein